MFKLCFYVPEKALEQVKQAVFAAGAGRYENYESSCWQAKGVGQFKPLTGSDPDIGEHGKLALVDEYKVEMICAEDNIDAVIHALKSAHPYEVPAYEVFQILNY